MILISTGCPKCKILKKKLEAKGIEYELIEDIDKVNEFAKEHDIHEAPVLVLDNGTVLNFIEANKYLV